MQIAARSLFRAKGFSLTAVLTLSLGIGLSTAVFTVADALLLRKLPVRDQDRIVALWGETRDRSFRNVPLSLSQARDFARQTRTMSGVSFFTYEGAAAVPIRVDGRITQINQSLVSGDYFDLMGVRPILGRALRLEDDVIGAKPVVVLSHRAWQRHFGGDSGVVGRALTLHGGETRTVVGVMPQGFDYPRGADFWATIVPSRTRPGEDSVFYADVDLVGRLRPGATPDNARDELTAFFGRQASPWARNAHGLVHTLPRLVLGDVRPAVIVFAIAVALLLVITCVNVANLLLVRGLARRREIAVRGALGASRRHIIMQLMTENGILAVAGGLVGVAIAIAAVQAFVSLAPAGLPRIDEIHVNAAMLAGAIAITTIAVLLFGLAPSVMTSRVELEQALRSDARVSATRGSRLATELMVAGQVGLAAFVLCAAGLIVRSFQKLQHADLAFQPANVLVARLAGRPDLFDTKEKQLAVLDRVQAAVKPLPGVIAVSPVVAVPFSFTAWDGRPAADGQTREQASTNPTLNMEVVEPDYFTALGIRILSGRGFTAADRDGAPPVVILSESAARHYWPGMDPIGKRVRMGGNLKDVMTVVGIVPNTRYRDLRDARPSIYFPLRQSIFPFAPENLVIRTSGDPATSIASVRRAIDAIDPGIAVSSAAPLTTFLDGPLAQPRLNALLLVVFAVAALVLAAIGLFGVMATMVRQRTKELGIRLALGATANDLRQMVVSRGVLITVVGLAVGLTGSAMANRFLGTLLYDVSPSDATTLVVVSLTLLVVTLVATLVPARSSTRIDPIIVLRSEG